MLKKQGKYKDVHLMPSDYTAGIKNVINFNLMFNNEY